MASRSSSVFAMSWYTRTRFIIVSIVPPHLVSISVKSSPEQKLPPAPLMTRYLMVFDARTRSIASNNSPDMATDKAFTTFGRLSVIRAKSPFSSKMMFCS